MLRAVKPTIRPREEHSVDWMDKSIHEMGQRFKERLDSATNENEIQEFLQAHPVLLALHLGGGHGRWVHPKPRFGAEHVPDFVIGEKSSVGYEWKLVELESPLMPLFTKAGNPSRYLTHAIRQIDDWKVWLRTNQNYASRPKDQQGLGFTDIDLNVPGLILMGRRNAIDPATNDRRRQMMTKMNIEIHSYDFLLDAALDRIESTGGAS